MELRLEFIRFSRDGIMYYRARILADDQVLFEMPGAMGSMEDCHEAVCAVAKLMNNWIADEAVRVAEQETAQIISITRAHRN